MHEPLLLHLATIKLAELAKHHAAVEEHYRDIEARLDDDGSSEVQRLEALVRGLQTATFAMKPLHPEAGDLQSQLRLIRLEAELGRPDLDTVRRWRIRLEEEIERGRTRARFAHLFGLLLEQDMSAAEPEAEPLPVDRWPLASGDRPIDVAWLDQHLERFAGLIRPLRERVAAFVAHESRVPARSEEVVALLRAIVQNPLRSEAMRRSAQQVLGDAAQVHECANVLTILLHHFEDWDWSEGGATTYMRWSHGKERPTAEAPLLDHLFVNLLGMRLALVLRQMLDALHDGPQHPLRPEAATGPDLDWLDVPDAPADSDPRRREPWDAWQAGLERAALVQRRFSVSGALATECLPASWDEVSEGGYRNPPQTRRQVRASPGEATNAMSTLLAELQAHIQLSRLIFPERPQYVLQTDYREFFGSLPHASVLALAERLGFDEAWCRFLAKWLAMPVVVEGRVHRVERGVARDQLLSWAFTALLGWLVDLAVHDAAGVPVLRVVDDQFLLAPTAEAAHAGFDALRRATAALGVEINLEKSGFVVLDPVDDAVPAGLPASLPLWGCLQLHADGSWQVAVERFATLREWIRGELDGARSVLDLVQRYNREITYVMYALGSNLQLGPVHREQLVRTLIGVHQDVFGEGHGIVDRLKALAQRLGGEPQALLEPLIHWPITAGGLGLLNPMIPLVATETPAPAHLAKPVRAPRWRDPVTRPQLHQHRQRLVAYDQALQYRLVELARPRHFEAPPTIGSLAAMTDAFIARGSEIGGRMQDSLSAYWRWVLATYGPLLLDRVGTFSFLPTELVPLPLILAQRGIVLPPTPTSPSAPATPRGDDIPF